MPKPKTVVMTAEHLRLMLRDERANTLADVDAVLAAQLADLGPEMRLFVNTLRARIAPLVEPAGAAANARGGGE